MEQKTNTNFIWANLNEFTTSITSFLCLLAFLTTILMEIIIVQNRSSMSPYVWITLIIGEFFLFIGCGIYLYRIIRRINGAQTSVIDDVSMICI